MSLLLLAACGVAWAEPDVHEIIRRSTVANDADFEAQTRYSHLETDSNGKTNKTFQVWMLDGSPYNQLVAVNNEPLPVRQRAIEDQKLRTETSRRKSESEAARAARIDKYKRNRQSEYLLMNEMTRAFHFELLGEDTLDGHLVYVLDATPRADYRPPNQKARVLKGMKGKLWIDTQQYHWAKVEAEIIHPVNFGFFIATVHQGTRFELEQEPVEPGVWLPKHFVETVNAKVLGIKSLRSRDEETYSDYRPVNGQISRR